jgi:hypothetical protein
VTIAIVVCLQDGALLIADGRQTYPLVADAKVLNDVNKISVVGKTVASISFGISIATDKALWAIRDDVIEGATSPTEVLQEIERSVGIGWNFLLTNLAPDVNMAHRAMRAGMLVGGYLPMWSRFIGGVLFRPDAHDAPTLVTKPFGFIVLGAEENNSHQIFKQVADRNFRSITSSGAGIQNSYVKAFLAAGAATIREVERVNPEVGGIIRYAILRRNFPYFEDILEE